VSRSNTKRSHAPSYVSKAPSLSPSDSPSNIGMKRAKEAAAAVSRSQSRLNEVTTIPRDPSPVRSAAGGQFSMCKYHWDANNSLKHAPNKFTRPSRAGHFRPIVAIRLAKISSRPPFAARPALLTVKPCFLLSGAPLVSLARAQLLQHPRHLRLSQTVSTIGRRVRCLPRLR
jgi:hypothetical protein